MTVTIAMSISPAHDNTDGLPEGWALTTLRDACEINPPKAPKDSLPANALVTFVPMPAVDAAEGAITAPQTRRFSEVRKGFTSFREKDVIMAKITPCMENGKAAIAKNLTNGLGFGSTEFHVLRCTEAALPEFVYQFIRQESYRKASADEMTGSVGQKRVPQWFLEATDIPLPPLSEQTRIVTRLTELLTVLKASHERLSRVPLILKRFRQAVLAAACSGRLTLDWRERSKRNDSGAIALLKEISTRRAKWLEEQKSNREAQRAVAKVRSVYVDRSSYHDLPEGWAWSSLLEACWLVVDCHNKTAPYQEEGIPLVRTTNIKGGQLLLADVKHISEKTYQFWSRRCPPQAGDVLFTREAPMGECAVIPSGFKPCMGQRIMLLRVFQDLLSSEYLSFAIREPGFQSRLDSNAVGSGVKHLRVGDVEKLVIPMPPVAEQQEIVHRLRILLSLADRIEAHCVLARQRTERSTQSILAKAFRGELVPTEAELARREGREYEPASVLLERIKRDRVPANTESKRSRSAHKGRTVSVPQGQY